MATSDCLKRNLEPSELRRNSVRSLVDQSARRANAFLIHLVVQSRARNIQSITLSATASAHSILILAPNRSFRAPVLQLSQRDRRQWPASAKRPCLWFVLAYRIQGREKN